MIGELSFVQIRDVCLNKKLLNCCRCTYVSTEESLYNKAHACECTKTLSKHCITSDFDHNRSTASSANMSWRDIVTNWLLTQQENLAILDLLRHLIQANMIPSTLIDNSTLHSIMLTQVMLETLNGVRPNQMFSENQRVSSV